MFNYQKICQPLFRDLTQRTKEVIFRRFALEGGERETLESIGGKYGLTRERVRQIEEDGLRKIRKSPFFSDLSDIFQKIKEYFKKQGGFKREDILFQVFDTFPNSVHPVRSKSPKATAVPQTTEWTSNGASWVFFLLTLGGNFLRFVEKKDLYSFWAADQKIVSEAKKIIKECKRILEKEKKVLTLKDLSRKASEEPNLLKSTLEISKEIIPLSGGCFGLKKWPEVNPRGVKDLAYLVFKKIKNPLHFSEVTKLIDEFFKQKKLEIAPFSVIQANVSLNNKKTNPQTVHNELIRDSRFVLVGRGIYALSEWGYQPGVVKEVISQTLREAKEPLSQEEILKKVMSQRLVKENTILLNLHDKECFLKTKDGKYIVKEA